MADVREFRDALTAWAKGGPDGPARDLAESLGARTAVLLEGLSDLAAVEALAAGRGRDLAAEGVVAVPMGGAMSVGRYARLLGRPGLGLRVTGLCDEREQGFYERGLTRVQAPPEDVHVCAADLEDELIRALGTAGVEEILHAEGDFRAWRTFQRQPAQRGRELGQLLRRFLGTKKGRKIRYGRLLVEALPPDRTPPPLDGLLAGL
ncbi:TOPRIM nucleotidyl transferase/hydrolase domain-containing protein [Streptomyces sp. NBC_01497]|uniref:TOPRIM nucleotidyl transferase/hydrolase domain-containing protein n=1 Tax=Streptomyces sp. NBC_01497 TaxID=2903885 RepID=UPI002E30B697|nr:TOPRIM nucleotidyl transferase/hydrolase domain-containing protein [Streptomyces sp. NBC_01497]